MAGASSRIAVFARAPEPGKVKTLGLPGVLGGTTHKLSIDDAEALRQVVSVGASLKQAAVLDNFCWGNPDKPDRLGGLVRAAYGCYDAAKGFRVPFISGKDSLYNEFSARGKTISIPGTLLVSCVAVMDDVRRLVTMDLKKAGSLLYMVGETFQELGGSHYHEILKIRGGDVPQVDFKKAANAMTRLSAAIAAGLVASAHDCSEGGFGVAVAEMAFSGGLGANVFLSDVLYKSRDRRDDLLLFSESNSRFIVEVERPDQKAFEKALKGAPVRMIGCVTDSKTLKVYGSKGGVCLDVPLAVLKEAWQGTLKEV